MNTFHCAEVQEVADGRSQILQCISDSGFAIIRGVVDQSATRNSLDRFWTYVDQEPKHGSANASRDLVRRNSLKWSVGGYSPSQSGVSRLMLTAYNPLSAPDVLGCHWIFRLLIATRDVLAGRTAPLWDGDLPQGCFNATRLQVYPRGGGFMSAHKDSTASRTHAQAIDGTYLQPLVVLTERPLDFKEGGAFVVSPNGQSKLIESETRAGDIIVYDEGSIHGVADIDPQEVLDSLNVRGRVVALATIYE